MEDAHTKSVEEILTFFRTDDEIGFSEEQVQQAQEKYGPNGKTTIITTIAGSLLVKIKMILVSLAHFTGLRTLQIVTCSYSTIKPTWLSQLSSVDSNTVISLVWSGLRTPRTGKQLPFRNKCRPP